MKRAILCALILTAVRIEPVSAHHFLVAAYQIDRTVTIEGKVVQFLLRKPHSYVRVERNSETWLVEWGDAGALGRQGVSFDSLRPGDHVLVTGNPARNAEHQLRMVTIRRVSDGWQWSER